MENDDTVIALLKKRNLIERDIESALKGQLMQTVCAYVSAFGKDRGMEVFSHHLCEDAAQKYFSRDSAFDGWSRMVLFMKKISG
jgi:hypothetical protein